MHFHKLFFVFLTRQQRNKKWMVDKWCSFITVLSAICFFLVVVANILSAFDFFVGDSSFGFGYLTRTICYKIASNCRGEACYCEVPDFNRYLKWFVSLTFYWFCCFCQTIIALMWQLAKIIINYTRIAFKQF